MFDYKSDLKEALRAFNNKTKLDGFSTYSPLLAVCRREGWRFVPWRVDGEPVRSDDTPRIDVDSDEFKKWFDDSVMVGADGRPLSFWHGTFKDFELFDDSPATRLPHRQARGGLYFTGTRNIAHSYGYNILEVCLKIRQPYVCHDYNEITFPSPETIAHHQRNGYDALVFHDQKVLGEFHEVCVFSPDQVRLIRREYIGD